MRASDSDAVTSQEDEAATTASSSAQSPPPSRSRGSLIAPSVLSNSSSRSIAGTFSALGGDDVAFFDEVVASLSPGDDSFASLKAVYQKVRGGLSDINEVRDAHLWNCLLSLVKVRGRDWSERWDAVRLEIGLDLRDADLTGSSLPSEAQVEPDSGPYARSREARAGWTHRATPTQPRREEWSQDMSQSDGSNADCSSESADDQEDYWDQCRQSSATSSLTTVGAEAGQSTPSSDHSVPAAPSRTNARKDGILALQARMASLTRQAGDLTLQAGGRSAAQTPRAMKKAAGPDGEEEESAKLSPPLQSDSRRGQRSTFLSPQRRSKENRIPPSPSLSSDLPLRLQQTYGYLDRSPESDILSAIRSSRGSLRDLIYRKAEENEEVAWKSSAEFAQRHYEGHLLAACFGWWHELFDRQITRRHKAQELNAQGLLLRMLDHWKHSALSDRDVGYLAVRADAVRSQLSAWRKWRRLAQRTRTQRWEGRKAEMRESYIVVKEKRQRREHGETWHQWRSRLLEKRSATFRNGHLLGGAFFLWRLNFGVAQTLGVREQSILADSKLALLTKVFNKWRTETKLMALLDRWEDERAEQKLRHLLPMWKKTASLKKMEKAYSAVRLQRNGLQTWLQRLAELGLNKRRQTQADRRFNKSTQSRALRRWSLAIQHAKRRDSQALNFRQMSDRRKLSHALASWRTEGRARLFQEVHDGRLNRSCLAQWQGVYTRKVIEISRHAQHFAASSDRKIISSYLSHWQTLVRMRRDLNAQAIAIDARDVQAGALQLWRSVRRHHLRKTEQAAATGEWLLLKRIFTGMRAKVRATKLYSFSEEQDVRLLKRSTSLWRARATQQSVDRLGVAHIQSITTLRIERQTLQRWTQRVIERRSLLIEVGEAHGVGIALKAFRQWRRSRRRVKDLQQLGQSFRDVKMEDATRRSLLRWSQRYRRARSLRERAARFIAFKEDSRRSQAFVMWYDSWREVSLRGLEYKVALQRQADAKSRVLNVWMYKTTSFPAIRLDHSRLKRLALRKWREELPGAISRRQAVRLDGQFLVRKAFYHWIDSGKAQRAVKAAARFGGQSMARLRRHSFAVQSPFLIKARRSSGTGYQRSSSPLVREDLGTNEESGSLASVPKARSEVLEIVRPSSRMDVPRPRTEAKSALHATSAAAQRFQDLSSTSREAHPSAVAEIDGATDNAAASVSRSITPVRRSSSRKAIRHADERLDRLAEYRVSVKTFSSASSDRRADYREGTFSLTSHEAHQESASQRASRGIGTRVGARSLPSLSAAASEAGSEGQRGEETEALTKRPTSPITSASTSASLFAPVLRQQGGMATPLRQRMVERAHSAVGAHELHHSRSETKFLEDLRRKRRAMMERQT